MAAVLFYLFDCYDNCIGIKAVLVSKAVTYKLYRDIGYIVYFGSSALKHPAAVKHTNSGARIYCHSVFTLCKGNGISFSVPAEADTKAPSGIIILRGNP